jgi:thiol-disulfide isomerase/thioredoxin
MKTILAVLVTIAVTLVIARGQTNDPSSEVRALVQQVQTKLLAGKSAEADYAGEIKAFDTFIAKEKSIDPTNAAEAAYMKAKLYEQVFDDLAKTKVLYQQLTNDYPQTKYGQRAAKLLETLDQQADQEKRMAEEEKKQDELVGAGKPFPDFSERDLDGKPISVGALKGKVVMVDFWATWCGPCRGELPNVIATYKKHHAEGFEIIGVSLDEDRSALDKFLKETDGMTWPQFFDGKGWGNKLANKYLVHSIPFAVLVGPDGKIIGTRLRGEALEAAVTAALAKK